VAPRRIRFLIGTAVTVLTLDIVSKVVVVTNLSDREIRLLGGFLTLLVSRNPGAAFSIGTSMTVVFSLIAVSVAVVILRTSRQIRSIPWAITLGLLLGGATGNLIDRIFRYPGLFRGYVVDWIEIPHWPVFNLADSAIVCGGVLAVILSARGIRLDGSKSGPGGGPGPGGGDDGPQDDPGPGGRSEPAPGTDESMSGRNGTSPPTAVTGPGAGPAVSVARQARAGDPAPLTAARPTAPQGSRAQPGEPSGGGG
jgi:signal peptidase II